MSEATERFTVVVADKVSPSGLISLTEDDRFELHFAAGWEPGRAAEVLERADGLIVRSATKVTRELLAGAPKLRVVGRAGVGVDNIDLEAATERGIPVLNAPEGNTVSAAELTMALILAMARRVVSADRSVRGNAWKAPGLGGVEVRAKTLGLIGAGRIGGEVARRARAFGMVAVAYDPYLSDSHGKELGLTRCSFDDVLEQADFVTLHVPLTPSTTSMIGAEQFRRMKPTAYLVNAARGGVVDEAALATALTSGELAGAALDVFSEEPLPDASPLREAPNLILTPHLGASTTEAQELVALEIADAVRGALLDGDLSRAVNAPAIGGEALRKLRPLLRLGRRMGRLACALATGGIRKVEVRYSGASDNALGPVSASVLSGLLEDIVGRRLVNFVNAPHLAETRGIRLVTARSSRHPDYAEYLVTALETERGPVRIAGALLDGTHPRIVGIDDFKIDMIPQGTMIVLRNQDVPGVIGHVGTLLASMDINIAVYHQARLSPGGEAMAAVSVDGDVTPELLARLKDLEQISDVRGARLG